MTMATLDKDDSSFWFLIEYNFSSRDGFFSAVVQAGSCLAPILVSFSSLISNCLSLFSLSVYPVPVDDLCKYAISHSILLLSLIHI